MESPSIDRAFAEYLLRAFDDPQKYGVHQLFNDWWRFAPDAAKQKYLADFDAIPEQREFLEEGYFAEPLDAAELAALPEGSLGRAYHEFLTRAGLMQNLARDYRLLHRAFESAGQLDGMPEPMKYAVLRGFQTHDFQHLITGYDTSPAGEVALQAFCLAQIRFPYFGMWMSVLTTRMTYLDPDAIRPVMDAITEGWQLGRRVRNLQFGQWERRLEEPLAEVRQAHGIAAQGRRPLAA